MRLRREHSGALLECAGGSRCAGCGGVSFVFDCASLCGARWLLFLDPRVVAGYRIIGLMGRIGPMGRMGQEAFFGVVFVQWSHGAAPKIAGVAMKKNSAEMDFYSANFFREFGQALDFQR